MFEFTEEEIFIVKKALSEQNETLMALLNSDEYEFPKESIKEMKNWVQWANQVLSKIE